MIRKKINLLLFFILLLFVNITASAVVISDYHQTFIPLYNDQGQLQIAIRMYYVNTKPYFLVVNPNTFATQSAPAIAFSTRKLCPIKAGGARYYTMQELQNTPYMKALTKYTSPPYILQNYGILRAENPMVKGMFLTADMCPSALPFETNFFNTLAALADKTHHPTPIALSVTGLWMIDHPKEFNWLIAQENAQKLQITWINHSFSHVYYADVPLQKNFLLTEQTNFTQEVLAPEKILLEHGQLPSVFFRFPGLVASQQVILELRKFSLIPIGSNAWLAKGQAAKAGSIILVHGNSNEPEGIKLVMPLLQNPHVQLLPLSSAF